MLPGIDPQTSLRTVIDCPGGGRCMMAGFPGLGPDQAYQDTIDDTRAKATLTAIHAQGARLLVVLAEASDLPAGAFDTLRRIAGSVGLDLAFLPIRDYHAPDPETYRSWRALCATRDDLPNRGGAVAFTCRHGAGRSGLMAALVLLEDGLPLDQAVTTIRAQFSEAIETDVQMTWLNRVSARLKDESTTLDVESDATHS